MEILMLLGLAVLLTVFQGVVLAYLWRESNGTSAPPVEAAHLAPSQFFGPVTGHFVHGADTMPLGMVLQQLEQHIRLEQAAAESYHSAPTIAGLHKQMTSSLLH